MAVKKINESNVKKERTSLFEEEWEFVKVKVEKGVIRKENS